MTKLSLEATQDLAREVLGRVRDCDIRVARMMCTSQPYQGHRKLTTDTSLSLGAGCVPDAVVCISTYEVNADPIDDGVPEDEDRWSVGIEVHGMWQLTSSEGLTSAHAQAFTLAVGALALHPYARSHIQTLVGATGYPPFTLEILNSLLVPAEGTDDIDLGVVIVHDAEGTEIHDDS